MGSGQMHPNAGGVPVHDGLLSRSISDPQHTDVAILEFNLVVLWIDLHRVLAGHQSPPCSRTHEYVNGIKRVQTRTSPSASSPGGGSPSPRTGADDPHRCALHSRATAGSLGQDDDPSGHPSARGEIAADVWRTVLESLGGRFRDCGGRGGVRKGLIWEGLGQHGILRRPSPKAGAHQAMPNRDRTDDRGSNSVLATGQRYRRKMLERRSQWARSHLPSWSRSSAASLEPASRETFDRALRSAGVRSRVLNVGTIWAHWPRSDGSVCAASL